MQSIILILVCVCLNSNYFLKCMTSDIYGHDVETHAHHNCRYRILQMLSHVGSALELVVRDACTVTQKEL